MAQYYDTLLAEYVKNPWVRGLWLDKLAENKLDYEMVSYDVISDKKKLNFKDVELSKAAIYSAEDVVITHQLYTLQQEDELVNGVLNEIDIPLMQVLKNIEINGVKVDRNKLKEIGDTLAREIEVLQKEIIELAWVEFNIKSPKQVWEVLFDTLDLPKWKKTKTGWSVSADVLSNLAKQFPIAQKIIDFRHYSKLLSTYINGLLDLINSSSSWKEEVPQSGDGGFTDLVHTNYNQAVTATWRLSSTKPNLQNIPSSNWIAGEIRKAFVSRFDWWIIMALDYSQVEVRLLAIMSGDENLLSAFKSNEDIHEKTAQFLGWAERKIAKAVNFWVIYWISGFGLAKMIDITVSDWNVYIKKFYENYPKVREYFDKIISDCETKWYVETMHWRRRYIKWINDRNKMIKSWAEREAINMPIQWTSADIIKIAMIRVDNFLAKSDLKTKLIMQVHDELVFDVFPWEESTIEKEVKKIMESILTNSPITLKVDCEYWESWKDAK